MINGVFDGGHFVLRIYNYLVMELSQSGNYSSGLVQHFKFYDNNQLLSNVVNYSSWMDVNYYTGSLVEINLDAKFIQPFLNTYSFNYRNLIGKSTYDILSSDSYFKDYTGTNIRLYNLGIKYDKYRQLNPTVNFDKPFSNVISTLGIR
jgi:hypothetical protein